MAKAGGLFSTIKGQDRAAQFLQTAIAGKKLPSTLLFAGPSGVGRRLTALATLQALVCENKSTRDDSKTRVEACGACGPCIRIAKRESESLIELAPQGATTKIEQIRAILRELSLQNSARARGVIVDDAHLMTAQSANALLKTLEEPPANTWFFLMAPSVSSVLPTIRSRSQIVQFNTLTKEIIDEILLTESMSGDDKKGQSKAEPWQVEAARGRLDNLQALLSEEVIELRNIAFSFWQAQDANDSIAKVSEAITSRENSLWVVRFWQELLRDGFYQQMGLKPIIHQDQIELIERVAGYPQSEIERLSVLAAQLERDIRANADYNLAIDNFARNEVYVTE